LVKTPNFRTAVRRTAAPHQPGTTRQRAIMVYDFKHLNSWKDFGDYQAFEAADFGR